MSDSKPLPNDGRHIEVGDGKFFHCVGMLDIPPSAEQGFPFGGDLFATFYRLKDDAPDYVRVDHRFRYNVGWNSKPEDDKKKFFTGGGTLKDGETPISVCRGFFANAAAAQEEMFGRRGGLSIVEINGDAERFIEVMSKQKWAHMTKVDAPPKTE